MEFVVWGVTQLGRYLAKNLMHAGKSIKTLAFIDQNIDIQNTQIDGIPVISYEELLKKPYRNEIIVVIAMKNAKSIFQVLKQMEDASFANVGIAKSQAMFAKIQVDPYKENGEIIWNVFEKRKFRIIPRIEMNLIDACNLKCKGCTHFSSIFSMDSIYPLDNYRKDLIQLRNIGRILRIRLLGGEPFLLNNLDEYIRIVRDIFPESDIEIVTNGILIPKVNGHVLSSIKSSDICVAISPYKPTLKIKDQITSRLDEYGVWWKLEGGEILTFSRNLTLKNNHDMAIASQNCLSATCTFLRQGKLYKCPVDGLFHDFCRYYKLKDEAENGTDIYGDIQMVYDELVNYAQNPIERCKYCAEYPELISWSVKSSPSLSDWLYGESEV